MRPDRLNLPAILCVALVVAPYIAIHDASAHSLRVLRGTATITGDTLEVQFEPGHHGDSPLLRLSVRDAQGVRLASRRGLSSPAGAHAKGNAVLYWLAPNARYVSFQLDPPGRGGAGPAANVVLAVRVNGEDREALYLANRGNVAVVRLASSTETRTPAGDAESSSPCASRRRDWIVLRNGDRSVRSIVAVEDWGVRIELLIPTPVIETWAPIVRAHRDYFEPDERRRALAELKTIIANRLGVRVDGANSLVPIIKASFLDSVSAQRAADEAPGRLSIWTTGVLFTVQFRSVHRPKHVDVHWKLFNAIVLTAHALTVTPGDCTEFTFSTYNAHWLWERP